MAGIPNWYHHTLLLLMGSGLWASLMRRVKASAGHYLYGSQVLVVGAQARGAPPASWLHHTALTRGGSTFESQDTL